MDKNYCYCFWPGTYSFRDEIALFIVTLKDKLDEVLDKIDETETALAQ